MLTTQCQECGQLDDCTPDYLSDNDNADYLCEDCANETRPEEPALMDEPDNLTDFI